MAGLLGAYEDSDEDDDAPSILQRQATADAEKAAGGAPTASPPGGAGAASTEARAANGAAAARGTTLMASPLAGSASPFPGEATGSAATARAGAGGAAEASGALLPQASDSSESEAEEADNFELPPSPPGEPDPDLLERVRSLHELRRRGKTLRDHIQGSRDWSNPYILERVIKVFGLNEHGSNFPPEIFDPAKVAEHPSDYYDAPECERPPLPKRLKRSREESVRKRVGAPAWIPPSSPLSQGTSLERLDSSGLLA
eukprot:TRINITY_DN32480_c0_g1_i1.p1 TRINITY_DN32480_c0_g1~~TRINITY_DN32480_c0_g1_i1.p1  ORF type:complete len:257 (+),score=57.32 TRINITY_DN32480_c0_g1_i1:145-915(+)